MINLRQRYPKEAITALLFLLLLVETTSVITVYSRSQPILSSENGRTGDIIQVEGREGDVASGYLAMLYWDSVQSWDGSKGLLNVSQATTSGYYNMTFKVPQAAGGPHYLWVGDSETSIRVQKRFDVLPTVKFNVTSTAPTQKITLKLESFSSYSEIAVFLIERTENLKIGDWGSTQVSNEIIGSGDGVIKKFSGTTQESPLKPGSIFFTSDMETFTDNGKGILIGDESGEGKVDYVTGDYTVRFSTPPADSDPVNANYDYFDDSKSLKVVDTGLTADSMGSVKDTVRIPFTEYGEYWIAAMDSMNYTSVRKLAVGPTLETNAKTVDVGDVIRIDGSGFLSGSSIDRDDIVLSKDGWDGATCNIINHPSNPIEIDGLGEITLDAVIPQVPTGNSTYLIDITDSNDLTSSIEVFVEELAEIEVKYEYSPDTIPVKVTGENYPPESPVKIKFQDLENLQILPVKTISSNNDGSFKTSFNVHTSKDASYMVIAESEEYNIRAEGKLVICSLMVSLSSYEGAPEEKVTLKGSSFSSGYYWSASFGSTNLYDAEEAKVNNKGVIKIKSRDPTFLVPEATSGTYIVTVRDLYSGRFAEIEFEVTGEEAEVKNTEYPVAEIVAPSKVSLGEEVLLNGSLSYDPDGVIMSYDWRLGDGATGTGTRVKHTYKTPGTYTVTLEVTDNMGARSKTTKNIEVMDKTTAVDFSVDKSLGKEPLKVTFTDETYSLTEITEWTWDLGDGSTSSQQHPAHVYMDNGTYSISLQVRDSDGEIYEKTIPDIVIVEPADYDSGVISYAEIIYPVGEVSAKPAASNFDYLNEQGDLVYVKTIIESNIITAVTLNGDPLMTLELQRNSEFNELFEGNFQIPPNTPDGLYPLKIRALDQEGNLYKKQVFLKISSTYEQFNIPLQDGWVSFELPFDTPELSGDILQITQHEVELNERLTQLHPEHIVQFKKPVVESIWTLDLEKGFIFYDPVSCSGDLKSIKAGQECWAFVSDYPSENMFLTITRDPGV